MAIFPTILGSRTNWISREFSQRSVNAITKFSRSLEGKGGDTNGMAR